MLPDHFSNTQRNLGLDVIPVERTFGLLWIYNYDIFIHKAIVPDFEAKTETEILRIVSSIFDSFGFLAVVTLIPKQFL